MREPYEREAGHIAGTRHIALHRPAPRRPRALDARAAGRLLLPRRLALDDGRAGVARRRLRGLLDARRPAALGRGGPAALARGRPRGRPLTGERCASARACAMVMRTDQDERRDAMEASTDYPGVTEGDGYAVANLDDLGDGPGLSQGPQGARRDRLRRQRDRPAARHRDRLSLPRHAGGAVLRPPRHDRDGVRRRLGAASCARAASRAWTPPPCARCATSATSTPSTCAPAARTATSAATAACARARSSASKPSTTSPTAGRLSVRRRAR